MNIVFSITLFTSSMLVFLMQPMFSKMVLPMLGGSPMVWNTAMLFFQSVLLLGYVYSHLITERLDIKKQMAVQFSVMLLAFVFLPVSVSYDWNMDSFISIRLILLFSVCIGVPFFAVCTMTPLIQKWFSLLGEKGREPYFLYSIGNMGSLLALVSYPLFLEPFLTTASQSFLWAVFYAVLLLLTGACAFFVNKADLSEKTVLKKEKTETKQKLLWCLYAFVPSSLLLGVTAHISADIAPVPLLWIVPLFLYLLSFVVVFAREPMVSNDSLKKLHVFVSIVFVFVFFMSLPVWLKLSLHLAVFFFFALLCHGTLSEKRPEKENLTEFYMFIALGGVLGGVFNTLAAPLLFNNIYEYPVAVIAAIFIGCTEYKSFFEKKKLIAVFLVSIVCVVSIKLMKTDDLKNIWQTVLFSTAAISLLCLGGLMYMSRKTPVSFALSAAVIMCAVPFMFCEKLETVYSDRSFFGVSSVKKQKNPDRKVLYHGKTVHGMQFLSSEKHFLPTVYYSVGGPAGQFFYYLNKDRYIKKVASIGLGTGSMACYGLKGQKWKFFEIDKTVKKIAIEQFDFIDKCSPGAEIAVGDGRLLMEKEENAIYDLIIVDVFNSDALPVHMFTEEAISLYMKKLLEKGLLLFHITNKYMDITPVLAAIAEKKGYSGKYQHFFYLNNKMKKEELGETSRWVVMARKQDYISFLNTRGLWSDLSEVKEKSLWTDGFSNVLSVIKWRH